VDTKKLLEQFQELETRRQNLLVKHQVLENKLETLQKNLEDAKARARELFGVDEPEQIESQIESLSQEIEKLSFRLETNLQKIEAVLRWAEDAVTKIEQGEKPDPAPAFLPDSPTANPSLEPDF